MTAVAIGYGACNGSFGELLQGILPDGSKFLINLPIATYSRATVTLRPWAYCAEADIAYAESYRQHGKAHRAVRVALGSSHDYGLTVDSDLPRGKGLSSSTADCVAALRAVWAALGEPEYSKPHISEWLHRIEPHDGLHYDGICVYLHEAGKCIASYPWVPEWSILGVDSGGTVDTVEFNARPRVWRDSYKGYWEILLSKAMAALEKRDESTLANIASDSTNIWQLTHPKSHYPQVLNLAYETEALGVVNCHSGTYLGLIYPVGQPLDDQVALVQERMPECSVRVFRTLGGAWE